MLNTHWVSKLAAVATTLQLLLVRPSLPVRFRLALLTPSVGLRLAQWLRTLLLSPLLFLPLHAQEMQIGDAVNDPAIREIAAHHRRVFAGVGIAMQIDQIRLLRRFAEHFLDRPEEWMMQTLDADFLEIAGVGFDFRHVVGGQERDLVAEVDQRADMIERGVGSRVLVGRGHGIVDEIRALANQTFRLPLRHVAVEAVRQQGVFPAAVEFGVVDELEPLHAGSRRIGAGADPLQMHDGGRRLHHDALAFGAHAEGEIGILIIGGREQFIEPAEVEAIRERAYVG